MDWVDFAAGVAVGMVGTDVLRFLAWRILWRHKPEDKVEFREAAEFDPDPPKGSAARISKINFQRRTDVRRPVRRYTTDEDASDPFRD
jgi:hypothetical protein